MTDIYEEALAAHKKWRGKIEVTGKQKITERHDLSLAYTPGVAAPCLEIEKDPLKAYDYTWKGNIVAVVTDGTAVLGLGDIGPQAALPVMEGKALLFKEFAGVNAIPICLDTKDPDEIVSIITKMAPTFGGINLEDISAPRCVEIENRLIEALDIPVFHDDQHGTAIVVLSALINALKLVHKTPESLKVVVSGAGAAGSAIIKMLLSYGVKNITAFDKNGVVDLSSSNEEDPVRLEIARLTDHSDKQGTMKDALVGADVFIGVSAPKLLTQEMVHSMADKAIVFAMANPEPEITYQEAIEAGAMIVGTGRSDQPNQINNVLAFPGLFKGALTVGATKITKKMQIAAAQAIADLIPESELTTEYIIPDALNKDVAEKISEAVQKMAVTENVIRK
ncbi:hypothetical protein RU97_GL001509 [Enterococcus canis]|uniref:Malate dehydrogenase n=1 Tax=Enterococcus canis TaxID=214095 RepID=A0A1L8RGH9_9ENTE|nr:NADP-dependent malic enzyme [Enterococcus canis]OJG18891.1 hypothetical protein RU97_GL001509 [Enterococcus canis]